MYLHSIPVKMAAAASKAKNKRDKFTVIKSSLGFGRGSRVEGTESRVEGNMSRVESAKSRVLRK